MGEVRALRSTNDERIKADSESWLAYENDAKARAVKGSIFSKSNTHLPLTGMIVDYFLNLAEDELADQPPFFAFKPVGKGDNITADAYNHYYNWKVDTKGGASQVLRDGLTSALVQRALILKATHHVDKRVWVDRDRRVLIDLATASPCFCPMATLSSRVSTAGWRCLIRWRRRLRKSPCREAGHPPSLCRHARIWRRTPL